MKKYIDMIKELTGVEVQVRTEEDAKKLCQFVLDALAYETPRIAKSYADKVGLKITV